ncbi:hypothetical protein [Microbulbifer variabilis]|uniref:hypothetical protein n=1 Tax=Microbulbifer variabilis TaxID=266805 RepID=UPI001CFD31C3|nr:hypothetical protein [Microbulbifer variabilis]
MSIISSFYIFPSKLQDKLLESAKVKINVEKKLFGLIKCKTKDFSGFDKFLSEYTNEQEAYPMNGSIMVDLLATMEDEGHKIFEYSLEKSNKLGDLVQSSTALFDTKGANKFISSLKNHEINIDTIK